MITTDQLVREFEQQTGDRLAVHPSPPSLGAFMLPDVLDLRRNEARHAETNAIAEKYGELGILVYPAEAMAQDEYGDRIPDALGVVWGHGKRERGPALTASCGHRSGSTGTSS